MCCLIRIANEHALTFVHTASGLVGASPGLFAGRLDFDTREGGMGGWFCVFRTLIRVSYVLVQDLLNRPYDFMNSID